MPPPDGWLLRYNDGRPVTYRRFDGLWVRIGQHLPGARSHQVSTHWLRHITLIWIRRNFGFAVAHAYAGHTDGAGDTGSATSTHVRATLTEVATALAALTGDPPRGTAGLWRHGTPCAYGRPGYGPGPVPDGDRTGTAARGHSRAIRIPAVTTLRLAARSPSCFPCRGVPVRRDGRPGQP
jgi:hypothetical protein